MSRQQNQEDIHSPRDGYGRVVNNAEENEARTSQAVEPLPNGISREQPKCAGYRRVEHMRRALLLKDARNQSGGLHEKQIVSGHPFRSRLI